MSSTLTSLVVGLYVLIVGVVGLLAQSVGNLLLSVLATGLIAILFQPLRQRMQSVVNRLLYGERDDPVTVLEQLSRQLAQTTTPDAMLTTLVATVAHTLKLPYVALVTDDAATVIASQGSRTTLDDAGVEQWPLTHQGEIIGQLQIARRGRNESFPPPEQRLLQEIASRAGVALHAAREPNHVRFTRWHQLEGLGLRLH